LCKSVEYRHQVILCIHDVAVWCIGLAFHLAVVDSFLVWHWSV